MRERRARRSEPCRPWQAGWVGVLAAWLVVAPPGLPRVLANPEGEQVVVGDASFLRDAGGQRLDIHTATDLTVVDFEQASVGTGEALNVFQPTDQVSQFWARDGSGAATHIDGSVWSNAQVGYLNPYGIFLGGEALLDVSTFVAGAGEISNEDLLAGRLHFRELTGEVGVAAGAEILASEAVLLAGRRVANYGHIQAPGGLVAFASGGEVRLSKIDGRLRVRAEAPALDAGEWAIEQAGQVDAAGGYVSLTAGDHYSLALNHSGITRARDIELAGGDGGLVTVAGSLDASDATEGARGGRVRVLGERIALEAAQIDASGEAGGGEIRLGGDVRGGPALPTAHRTFVSADSKLRADALGEGEGGSVVVWAEERTGFYGEISARGGVRGGDGGFAEVSGRALSAPGAVDLGAARGDSGTLLYDPTDIVIEGGNPEPPLDPDLPGSGEILYATAGDEDSVFTISQHALETTDANILLEAAHSITVSGSFEVKAGEAQPSVDLLEGNSLSLRTRNDAGDGAASSADPGIDLVSGGSNSEQLSFRTTDADISLATGTGGGSSDVEAAIRVFGLEADGGAVSLTANNAGERAPAAGEPDLGVHAEQLVARGGGEDETYGGSLGVSISVAAGDIVVGEIRTDGAGTRAGEGEEILAAEAGGNVVVRADRGDVVLGRVSARGGDAESVSPGDGGGGAFVSIVAGSGEAGVGGDVSVGIPDGSGGPFGIDAGGGAGVLWVQTSGEGEEIDTELLGGRGGSGGVVTIDGPGQVTVGAVAVDGGDSAAAPGESPVVNGTILVETRFIAQAGAGGQIKIDGGAAASEESEPGAGDATAGVPVSVVGDLSARGGDGSGAVTVQGPLDNSPTTVGVAGGAGGILRVAGDGEVLLGTEGSGVVLDASGGRSLEGVGGSARYFDTLAGFESPAILVGRDERDENLGAVVGDIVAHASLRANGGDGVRGGTGGWVRLRSPQASVTHVDAGTGGIQANGGRSVGGDGGVTPGGEQLLFDDVAGDGGFFLAEAGTDLEVGSVSVQGGESETGSGGGENLALGIPAILLRSGVDESVETPRGDLRVTGLLDVSGGDGNGVYPPSDLVPEAGGADLEPPQGGGDAGRIIIEAGVGTITLAGGARGDAGGVPEAPSLPCTTDCPGTAGFAGFLDVRVANDVTGSGLESGFAEILVQQGAAGASTVLADDTGVTLLGVEGAASEAGEEPLLQRVTALASPDDFGALVYVLDVPAPEAEEGAEATPEPPAVDIEFARGLGALGTTETFRHEVINENGRIAGVVEGSGAHLQLAGALSLRALDVVDLEVEGVPPSADPAAQQAILALDVGGATDAEDITMDRGGEIGVTLSGVFQALEIVQSEIDAAIDVTGIATLAAADDSVPGQMTLASAQSPEGMALLLGIRPNDGSTGSLRVTEGAANLGGDLLLESSGDLVLEKDAVTATPAGTVALSAAGDIDAAPGGGDVSVAGAGALLLETRGSGNATVEMDGVGVLAADVDGDLAVDFRGQDLEISHAEVGSNGLLQLARTGIEAEGAVALTEAEALPGHFRSHVELARRIRLGSSRDAAPIQVRSGGDQLYDSSALEISNVRENPDVEGASLNDAILVSNAGGIEFTGRVDTAEGAEPLATLRIQAADTTTFRGDVGAVRELARLETSSVNLGTDTEAEVRSFRAGELAFLGPIDGVGEGLFLASGEAVEGAANLVFGGDIGTGTRLARFEASAELIEFAGAERVAVGAGGIALNTDRTRTEVPDVATVVDTEGNIAFETTGSFELGRSQSGPPEAQGNVEKFSAVGALRIQSDVSVQVGDLAAGSIYVSAPSITAMGRSAGQVLQPDGSELEDAGVDWVANDITTTAPIDWDGIEAPVKLVIGDGGVSVPESFVGVEVVRFGENIDAVTATSFEGPEGQTLDLTGSGPRLIGVPTAEIPRPEAAVEPFVPPRYGDEAPAPALAAIAPEVLALLDCAVAECADADYALSHPRRGPLSTPRAAEIAQQYREHVASAAARAQLRVGFEVAGEAFRDAFPGAVLSGGDFYRFLTLSRQHAGPRQDLDTLAALFAQVDLLGLSAADAARVQQRLASDFASGAALPGFDAPVVAAAVAASPVGLVR